MWSGVGGRGGWLLCGVDRVDGWGARSGWLVLGGQRSAWLDDSVSLGEGVKRSIR